MPSAVAGLKFQGFNRRCLSRKPAINNLEQGLQVIWSRTPLAKHMATLEELYEGRPPEKTHLFVSELFDVMVVRRCRGSLRAVLQWLHAVLKCYGRRLSPQTPTASAS